MQEMAEWKLLAAAMRPTVRRLLVDGAAPAAISCSDLLADLRVDPSKHLLGSDIHAHVMRKETALDAETCAVLRAAVDRERQTKVDSVDGGTDHQLNLSVERLRALVGEEAASGLCGLPSAFVRQIEAHGAALGGVVEDLPHELIVRRYAAHERPWIAFHADSAAVTVNVALSADTGHEGGKLVAVANEEVMQIVREEGEATVHDARLLHAVTRMTGGVRYSLILFFGRRRAVTNPAEAEMVRDGAHRTHPCTCVQRTCAPCMRMLATYACARCMCVAGGL